jgi:hydroxymethylpyrimidine/phosphomethylpyrimidine kinase
VTFPAARVLVLGGLDPSGGAGLTADARTLFRCGALALPVVTALTVQNRHGMSAVYAVSADLLARSFRAAVEDGPVHAVKVGLLAASAQVHQVQELLASLYRRTPIVVDPVLSATAGGFEPGPGLAAAIGEALAPLATVLTPNLPELERLAGSHGAAVLLASGCRAVLVKGGHGGGAELRDELFETTGTSTFRHARLPVGAVHGTGCALASALAAGLAQGVELQAACARAVQLVQDALRAMGGPDPSGLPRPLWLGG